MTVKTSVAAADAALKLANTYLMSNQVPYKEVPEFIRSVANVVAEIFSGVEVKGQTSRVVVEAVKAASENISKPTETASADEVDTAPAVETVAPAVESEAPKASKTKAAKENKAPATPVKPNTDMTLEEAQAVLAEQRGRGRPSREVMERRQLAQAVVDYHKAGGSAQAVSEDDAAEDVEAVAASAPVAVVDAPVKRKRGRPSEAEIAAREAAQAHLNIDEPANEAPAQQEVVLLKKGTVRIPPREEEETPVVAEEPKKARRGRLPSFEEIREYSSQGGLSDDPDAPNYRFKILSREPVVPPQGSYTEDYVTCLLDGSKRKVLKRYLATRYNMSEAQYRRHLNLPKDFPTVAPAYIRVRRDMAKQRNFGRTAADDFFKKPTEEAKVIKRTRDAEAA